MGASIWVAAVAVAVAVAVVAATAAAGISETCSMGTTEAIIAWTSEHWFLSFIIVLGVLGVIENVLTRGRGSDAEDDD